MAVKVRIGNDIAFTWRLNNADGTPYEVPSGDIASVALVTGAKNYRMEGFTVDENEIAFTFWGKDQKITGVYDLKLTVNDKKEGMLTYDVKGVLQLMAHSWETGGEDAEGVTVKSVELESTVGQVISESQIPDTIARVTYVDKEVKAARISLMAEITRTWNGVPIMKGGGSYSAKLKDVSSTASAPYSIALGYRSSSTAQGAYTEGRNTKATAPYSHAEGFGTITGEGEVTDLEGEATEGYAAHSEGIASNAKGTASHSEGRNTTAKGTASHSEGADNNEGNTTVADGDELLYSTAEGYASHSEGAAHAIGRYSHAEGGGNSVVAGYPTVPTAEGSYSHAEGSHTHAMGKQSHAEGVKTKASADNAHAEGSTSVASGAQSHAEGGNTVASANNAHAEGYNSEATGHTSHAEGWRTLAGVKNSGSSLSNAPAVNKNTVEGNYTHSEGNGTWAKGNSSHAEGIGTTASGYGSHAEGCETVAIGQYSHTEGFGTETTNAGEHAVGWFNASHTTKSIVTKDAGKTLSSIGFGSDDYERRNAFEVMHTGDAYFYGAGGYNGTNPNQRGVLTVQTLLNAVLGVQPTMIIRNGVFYVSHPLENLKNAEFVLMRYARKNSKRNSINKHAYTPTNSQTKKGFCVASGCGGTNYFKFENGITTLADLYTYITKNGIAPKENRTFGIALRVPNPGYTGPVTYQRNAIYKGSHESLWSSVLSIIAKNVTFEEYQRFGVGIK